MHCQPLGKRAIGPGMLPRTLSLAIDKARLRRAAPHVASGFRQVESGCEVAAEQAVERRGGISDPTDCDGPARWAGAAVVIRRDHQEVVTRIKLVEFDARGATRAACFFRGYAERVRIARSLQKKAAASSPASIDCTCSLPFGYGRCTLMTRAGPVRGNNAVADDRKVRIAHAGIYHDGFANQGNWRIAGLRVGGVGKRKADGGEDRNAKDLWIE